MPGQRRREGSETNDSSWVGSASVGMAIHSSLQSQLMTFSSLEEELGTTIYPGTEIMADVGTHHFVKSGAKSGRVLVPQPSEDPHDPLVRYIVAGVYYENHFPL